MKTLCLMSERYAAVAPELHESKTIIESDMKEDQPVDEELGAHIRALWHDPAIQLTYKHQAEFQLPDSAKYFFDKIDEVSELNIQTNLCKYGTVSTRYWK